MVTSSRTPRPPMMIPASSNPRRDRPPTAKVGELGIIAGQPGQRSRGDKGDGQDGGQAEGERGPDHRGGGLGPDPVGEVQRDEHDGHGTGHRDQDRAVAAQDGRDHEADDDQERQAQADQRADPLPAAEGDHRPDEQGGQDQQGPAPLEVLDEVGRGLAGLPDHGQPDLLTGPDHPPGGVGGVEDHLAAPSEPGGDLDTDRPGHLRVPLLTLETDNVCQGGRDHPGRVRLTGRRGPGQLTPRPQDHRTGQHGQGDHPDRRQHGPIARPHGPHQSTLRPAHPNASRPAVPSTGR